MCNDSSIQLLTQDLIDRLSQEALTTTRQRKNYNFHELPERVQRFLNVLQPGTYVRPHRHLRPAGINGFEFFLVLQGAIGMLIFNETGELVRSERLEAQGNVRGIELSEGIFHSLVVLEPNTVILEIKEGPYIPTTDKDFLPMFPSEGSAETAMLLQQWERNFT
ncbi:MAG: WbuC family cupin fold metalloprotein [Synechococcales bacterium]|nr:WbuC family cupin fold metalloprotein [Synechococcales bacterium]